MSLRENLEQLAVLRRMLGATREKTVFGEKVRAARKGKGMTLEDLSGATGMAKSYLSQIETGYAPPPRDEKVRRIAEALEMDGDELVARAHLAQMPAAAKAELGRLREIFDSTEEVIRALLAAQRRSRVDAAEAAADEGDEAGRLMQGARGAAVDGDIARAEALYREAVALREGSGGAAEAAPLRGLARLYVGEGRCAEAEPLLVGAVTVLEEVLGRENPDLGPVLEDLAAVRSRRGKYLEAAEASRRAEALAAAGSGAARGAAGDEGAAARPGIDLDSLHRSGLLRHLAEWGGDRAAGAPQKVRAIPVINKVAAGYPEEFTDLGYPVGVADEYIAAPSDLADPNAFAVRVVGESMEPRYHEGDYVVVSPAAEVSSGDDCFVRFRRGDEPGAAESTFKRVFFDADDRVRLQPLNEQYAPTVVGPGQIDGLYRAVARWEGL